MTIFFAYSWNMSAGRWPKNTQQWDHQGWTRKRSQTFKAHPVAGVSRSSENWISLSFAGWGEVAFSFFSVACPPPAMSKILELKLLLPIWCAVVTVMH